LGVSLPADDDDDSSYEEETESEVASSVVSSAVSTTLQERIAMQRQRQVAFLKNKGLLDDEKSLKGGAGAGSVTSGSPTSRSFSSGRRNIGRPWSPRLGIAQDEV